MLALWGCAKPPQRLAAVPEEQVTRAQVPGIPNARYWASDPTDVERLAADAREARAREERLLAEQGQTGPLPPTHLLALSGGGDNGAFGAGLLNGWTAAGTRPEFKVVTGISTGALIAPFAFLGPDYDEQLKRVYTTISQDDIFLERKYVAAILNDALADTSPLLDLVAQYVNEDMLAAIAEEYNRGRFLLIATTNLDARRAVIWNIGAIARSEAPGALDLVHRILVASAAIPGAFPPKMIDVHLDGQAYQEMHVDGGTAAQVFVYPPSLQVRELAGQMGGQREAHLYVIRNARLDPGWAQVERVTYSIAARAIASLIHTQGIGDLYRIYTISQRDGVDFNLAYIGSDFRAEHKGEFDTEYMNRLYAYGFDLGVKGYPWHKTPPGYGPAD